MPNVLVPLPPSIVSSPPSMQSTELAVAPAQFGFGPLLIVPASLEAERARRADAHLVVAVAGQDVGGEPGRLDLDVVVAGAGAEVRDGAEAGAVRAADGERVAAVAEVDVQRLDAAVGHERGREAREDAADLRRGHGTDVGRAVAGVVDRQHVAAAARGLDVEPGGDQVACALDVRVADRRPEACLAADVDRVRAVASLQRRVADDLPDCELVVAVAGVDRGRAEAVRIVDGHLVDLGTEVDRDGRQAEVHDVAGHATGAGDRDLCGVLGDLLRVGGVIDDLLAARVEPGFIAQREHVHAGAVEDRRAGGTGGAGADVVGRLAAGMEHRRHVSDRDRSARGIALVRLVWLIVSVRPPSV